ncbi:MAG: hypothetical protein N2578_02860, partial [Bdellovibrionaceae bacterium]|nr:hypothetical protein [Pseudobdellovibrionaceae bacterium]
ESLELVRIPLSSARQRAGRAARQYPGLCLRLWNKTDELSMRESELPEVQRSPLDEAILLLAGLGVRDPKNFLWFDPPDANLLSKARQELQDLQCLTPAGEITPIGQRALKFPLPPRLSVLLIRGEDLGIGPYAADLAALLQEKDFPLPDVDTHHSDQCDLRLRWESFKDKKDQKNFTNIYRAAEQIRRLVTKGKSECDIETHRKLLLSVFSGRLCRRRSPNDPRGVMRGGRGVRLAPDSQCRHGDFFVALSGIEVSPSESQIRLACMMPTELLMGVANIDTRCETVFTKENGFQKKVQKIIFDLPLSQPEILPLGPEEVRLMVPEFLGKNFDFLLDKNEGLRNWWSRWSWYKKKVSLQHEFTELEEAIRVTVPHARNWQDFLNADYTVTLESLLPPDVLRDFQRKCPTKIVLPNGTTKAINWSGEQAPALEIQLFEAYGWKKGPTVMDSSTPITLILLGPHGRPVQITKDLSSFWQGSWKEVRKEMRANYPRHYWPEDPANEAPRKKSIKD